VPLYVAVENLIHGLRYREVLLHLRPCERLADLGCGDAPRFLSRARGLAKECWGLDVKTPERQDGNMRLMKADISGRLPFTDDFLDQVTILAVLEHMENPLPILRETFRCLKPGGRLVLTTPSRLGIHVHEIIRRLRLIRDVEEGEHKDFAMSPAVLSGWTRSAGFAVVKAHFFELGMNVLLVGEKP
jgi:SAM-dependent methyltransferase